MRFSLRSLLVLVAIAAVVTLAGRWYLRSPANDLWGYGIYSVDDGTASSPVYFIEVRGVGSTPTIARVVKFRDHSAAPNNQLRVGIDVADELQAHVQNADRWSQDLTLIAGRSLEEKITITLNGAIAERLFSPPGSRLDQFHECDRFWEEHIAPHLPPESVQGG